MRFATRRLRTLGTALLILLDVQFVLALVGEFEPTSPLGRVLYPVYLGLSPWTLEHVGANLYIFAAALGALYWSYRLEGRTAPGRSSLA